MQKYSWAWKIYFFILLTFTIKDVFEIFSMDSQVYLYYLILRAFNPTFQIIYTQYLLRVALTAIHLIPLLLYIYRIRLIPAGFWKTLLILRLTFDLTGYSYELTSVVALYHQSPWIALNILVILFAPYIPSYVACYRYAFGREKMLKDTRHKDT